MDFTIVKTIFFVASALILLFLLIKNSLLKVDKLFILSLVVLTIIVLMVISFKVHHQLRAKFHISNTITYFLISIPFIYHVLKFKKKIFEANFLYFFLSCFFILSAVILDLLNDAKILDYSFLDSGEEILRIIGAVFWFVYSLLTTLKNRKYK